MLYLVVADAFKVSMPMHSLIADFEIIREGVEIHGCSIWVKPYNPTPLIVYNPAQPEMAIGDIMRAPSVERLLDFINLEAHLYPARQVMTGLDGVGNINFLYTQREIPSVETGYAKIEDGNFSKEIYEDLWNSAIADSVWRK